MKPDVFEARLERELKDEIRDEEGCGTWKGEANVVDDGARAADLGEHGDDDGGPTLKKMTTLQMTNSSTLPGTCRKAH